MGSDCVPRIVLRQAKRDQRLRRIVRRARTLAPHLDSPLFTPVLQSFGRISLLLQDSYEKLRNGDLIDDETGELRPSIDAVRKLSETQMRLAASLGLTPLSLRLFAKEKRVDLASAFAEAEDGEGAADDEEETK
jgi:hypothetical protein